MREERLEPARRYAAGSARASSSPRASSSATATRATPTRPWRSSGSPASCRRRCASRCRAAAEALTARPIDADFSRNLATITDAWAQAALACASVTAPPGRSRPKDVIVDPVLPGAQRRRVRDVSHRLLTDSQRMRTFKVERIVSAHMLPQSFDVDAGAQRRRAALVGMGHHLGRGAAGAPALRARRHLARQGVALASVSEHRGSRATAAASSRSAWRA